MSGKNLLMLTITTTVRSLLLIAENIKNNMDPIVNGEVDFIQSILEF